jgi:hypothetical protein
MFPPLKRLADDIMGGAGLQALAGLCVLAESMVQYCATGAPIKEDKGKSC